MRVGNRNVRRGPLAAAAGGIGLLGVVMAHRGTPPMMPSALPPATQAPAPASRTGNTSTPTTSSPAPSGTRTAVGAAEQYGYGELSVKVTVSGRKITDVSIAQIQVAEQYSQSIADQVVPMLRNEVLSAQSARINAISGATYTSEAYAYSLQSALDQLHM
jgi:uncharacterized protein with FMN-binding domain